MTLSVLVSELLEFYDDDRSTTPLLERVRELADPGATGPTDERKTLVKLAAVAPSPVADGPFHLLGDVAADARLFELDLRHALGLPARPRGGSGANTAAALRALVVLTEALPEGDELAVRVEERLAHLHSRARLLTGHRQPWPRVPLPCPVCEAMSLRQNPRDGSVRCVRPSCTDGEGRRTAWAEAELGWLGRLADATRTEASA